MSTKTLRQFDNVTFDKIPVLKFCNSTYPRPYYAKVFESHWEDAVPRTFTKL